MRGDWIAAHPCFVRIGPVLRTVAWGWCSTCHERHVIDLASYERGEGPWQPVLSGSSGPEASC